MNEILHLLCHLCQSEMPKLIKRAHFLFVSFIELIEHEENDWSVRTFQMEVTSRLFFPLKAFLLVAYVVTIHSS